MFRLRRVSFRFCMCSALLVSAGNQLASARADETADGSARQAARLEREVQLLIEDLQSDKRSIRSAAEAALKKRGPEILPFLPSPEILSNAAARESVRRIRILLEKERAQKLSRASTVTLHGEFQLHEIVAQISKQTGNEILLADTESIRQRFVAVDFDETPFWQAWNALLRQTKLTGQFDRRLAALRLSPPEEPNGDPPAGAHPVSYTGPFRLEITSLRRADQIGKAKPQRLRLNVNLDAEPRLRPLFLKYASADISLTTSKGDAIPAATPNAKWDLPWGTGETGIELRWDFLIPPDMPASELTCRGKVHVELASGNERFVFDDLAVEARIAQRRGGVIVGLEDVETRTTAERSRTNVRISVQYDAGGPAFESHRNWMFNNRAMLVLKTPAHGEKSPPDIRPKDFVTERQGDGTFVITYRFDNLPGDVQDYAFEYQAPTLLLMAPADFSFPQIDIPGPEPEK